MLFFFDDQNVTSHGSVNLLRKLLHKFQTGVEESDASDLVHLRSSWGEVPCVGALLFAGS